MKNLRSTTLIFLCSFVALLSSAQSESFKTVTIGTKSWMQANLDVTTFRNGDTVPQAKTAQEWKAANKAKQPAWCYYGFDQKNEAAYGKFYNFYAVNDPKNLAPEGYHISSGKEWIEMEEFVRTTYNGDEGKFVKQPKTWKGGAKATNETGLSILPSGLVNWDGMTPYKNTHAYFWLSDKITPKNEPFYSFFPTATERIYQKYDLDQGCGMSVRCVKD